MKESNKSGHPASTNETGNKSSEKQYDFSQFNTYFNEWDHPEDMVETLEELRTAYLELSIEAVLYCDKKGSGKFTPHDNVVDHSGLITDLIRLVKSL